MSAVLKENPSELVDADLLHRLVDLFSQTHRGNMGPALYSNGGAQKFINILDSKSSGGYTPFDGEVTLLNEHKAEIADWAKDLKTAIIVGPGPGKSVKAKEIKILSAMPQLERVISLELSPTFNRQSAAALKTALNLPVHAFEVDFRTADLSGIKDSQPALVITCGSFTNYEDCQPDAFPQRKVTDHIAKLTELAGSGGKILWGYNSGLNPEQYQGKVVDDFLLYPLVKASGMDGVILDPDGFVHETTAHMGASVLTHDWVATKDQDIKIHDEQFAVNRGERLHMFFSVSQSADRLARLVKGSSKLRVSSAFYHEHSSGAVIHGFDCR